MINKIQPTRLKVTIESYIERYKGWQRKLAIIHNAKPDEVPTFIVADYIINLTRNKRTSTWNQYRAVILTYIEENHINAINTIDALNGESLRRRCAQDTVEIEQRTSSNKAKGLTKNSLALVEYRIEQLRQAGIKKNISMINIIETIKTTGMRPIELFEAKLTSDDFGQKNILIIKNAKATNGRANGDFRTLILHNISYEMISSIEKALYYCHELFKEIQIENPLNSFEKNKNLASNNLRRNFKRWIISKISNWLDLKCDWPLISSKIGSSSHLTSKSRIQEELSRATLYTFRHQFFANAKAAYSVGELSREEIAAMGGHASIETHQAHYGRQVKGNSDQVSVKPTLDSVQRVNQGTAQAKRKTPHWVQERNNFNEISEEENIINKYE